jgi:hypothetical protein
VSPFRRNVELELLDCDKAVAFRVERAKYGTENAGANLVEDAKRTESVGRRAGWFRVQ